MGRVLRSRLSEPSSVPLWLLLSVCGILRVRVLRRRLFRMVPCRCSRR